MLFRYIINIFVFFAAVFTASAKHQDDNLNFVEKFEVLTQEHPMLKTSTPGRLGNFVWRNCADNSTDVFNVTALTITPDPVELPGTVTIMSRFNFKETVQSPIKFEVEFYKRLAGSTWLKIPCIADVGSCTYDDICDLLSLIPVCPSQLVEHNIPCTCPFQQGHYELPASTFEIPIPILPPGDYQVKGTYLDGEENKGCLELMLSFD